MTLWHYLFSDFEDHDCIPSGREHQQEPGGLGHGRQHRGLQRTRRQSGGCHLHRLWTGTHRSLLRAVPVLQIVVQMESLFTMTVD